MAVADRHVAQEFLTVDERLDDMKDRHPEYAASIESARRPAHALEAQVAEVTGLSVHDLVARLREEGRVSIIMIAHNYVHVLQSCDRVNLIQDGEITFDKPTADTSVEELNEIVVEEYRRARRAAAG